MNKKQKRILAKFITCQHRSRNGALYVLKYDPDYEAVMFLEYVYNVAFERLQRREVSYIDAKVEATIYVIEAVMAKQYKPIDRPITIVNTTKPQNNE